MGFVVKENRRLRTGFTTGFCAAAAAKAAAMALLTGADVYEVTVGLSTGAYTAGVCDITRNACSVSCSVIKDAGDDPDVTDGIRITATVSVTQTGIEIDGGEGIGRVTKPGLKAAVGKAAINPVPLVMIETALREACEASGYTGGLRAVISAPEGAVIAKRTMNERLGIVGGISILGTTGIVEPMSEKALIDTIKAEIDVRIAEGITELIITPGNYGFDYARDALGLGMESAVKCSNYIGEALDYARFAGVRHVTLVGHAGKLVKLAGGIMNTHSAVADCRMEIIAAHSGMAGAPRELLTELMDCVTVDAADTLLGAEIRGRVWRSIGGRIMFHVRERLKAGVGIRVIVFTQERGVLFEGAD